MVEDLVTDITNRHKVQFLTDILNSCSKPEFIKYCGDLYDFDRTENAVCFEKSNPDVKYAATRFIYRNDDCLEICVTLPNQVVDSIMEISKTLWRI